MGVVGYPGRAAYCATKHAVEGLTKALGVEWAPTGSASTRSRRRSSRPRSPRAMFEDPAFRDEVHRRLPTGRLATVEQVADAVRYLACDASGSVNGHRAARRRGWTAW